MLCYCLLLLHLGIIVCIDARAICVSGLDPDRAFGGDVHAVIGVIQLCVDEGSHEVVFPAVGSLEVIAMDVITDVTFVCGVSPGHL